MSSEKKLIFSSLKMALATLISRILGFIREVVFASAFGASGFTDAYHVAFRIPNILRDLFSEGTLSLAFIPTFTKVKLRSDEDAKRLFWTMFIILSLMTLFCSLGIFIFAAEIVTFFTDNSFTNNLEKFEITVILTRIMAPFLVFVSLAALFMGALNTYKIFFIPALSPATFNITMIISMIFFSTILKNYGYNPIYSLGIGVLLGGMFQCLFQIPLIIKKDLISFRPMKFNSPDVKSILNKMSIGTIGIAATQVNLLVTTILATSADAGWISWMQYGFRLFQFPVGIFGVSIGNSNLIHFSQAWKSKNKILALKYLKASYMTALFILLPITGLLFFLSMDIVTLSFERGAFGAKDTLMVVYIFNAYLIGIPFYGLMKIFAPIFYTVEKAKIPVIISIVTISLNILLCVNLLDFYGPIILVYGTSFSMIFITVVQSIFLYKELDLKMDFFINVRVLKFFIASIIMYLVIFYTKDLFFNIESISFFKRLFLILFFMFFSLVIYLCSLFLMKEKENMKLVFNKVLKKDFKE